jgi:hypothetical protein
MPTRLYKITGLERMLMDDARDVKAAIKAAGWDCQIVQEGFLE